MAPINATTTMSLFNVANTVGMPLAELYSTNPTIFITSPSAPLASQSPTADPFAFKTLSSDEPSISNHITLSPTSTKSSSSFVRLSSDEPIQSAHIAVDAIDQMLRRDMASTFVTVTVTVPCKQSSQLEFHEPQATFNAIKTMGLPGADHAAWVDAGVGP